jgi:hypothetical protein
LADITKYRRQETYSSSHDGEHALLPRHASLEYVELVPAVVRELSQTLDKRIVRRSLQLRCAGHRLRREVRHNLLAFAELRRVKPEVREQLSPERCEPVSAARPCGQLGVRGRPARACRVRAPRGPAVREREPREHERPRHIREIVPVLQAPQARARQHRTQQWRVRAERRARGRDLDLRIFVVTEIGRDVRRDEPEGRGRG